MDDAANVPCISARAKNAYRDLLRSEKPRAFAISPDGAYGWRSGGSDVTQRALSGCGALAVDFPCKLYAVDDAVVFKAD